MSIEEITNVTHKNVMEILVNEEVERQSKNYSNKINLINVATYALNRLPPLYASSKEGLIQQYNKGKQQHNKQIQFAVREGFMIVDQYPLKYSTPIMLVENQELSREKKLLDEIAKMMPEKDLVWILKLLKSLLKKIINQSLNEQEIRRLYYNLNYDWSDDRYLR